MPQAKPTKRERALQESEARTRAILGAAVDAIITIDEHGIIESVNNAAEQMFGYTAQEMIEQNVRMLMPAPYRDEHNQYLANYLATGENRVIGIGREVEGRRKDGSTFPMHLAVSELWLGDRRMFTGIARDVTDLRLAIGRLEESEARTRAIVQTAVDAIITIDERGFIDSLNPAAEQLFGYATDEVVGKNVKLLMPSPFREEHDAYLRNYLETGEKKIIGIGREVEGRRKDGSTFPMDLAVSEVQLGNRRLFTGIVRDISERKQSEQQLRFYADQLQAQNAELTRINEELERFTYTVSHDLKSPIVTIKNLLGRIEQNLAKGKLDHVHADIGRIDAAAQRMWQLLSALLELSRVGRVVNPPEAVALGELAREVVELCGGPIRERGLTVWISPDLPVVRGDRIRLREVFQNLLENAVKFTAGTAQPLLEISVQFEGKQPVVCFRDNGVGILPQYQQKVFGMFEQLDRDSDGSGIGLALVKRIIESHGGKVWVESQGQDKGSAFYFTLGEVSIAMGA